VAAPARPCLRRSLLRVVVALVVLAVLAVRVPPTAQAVINVLKDCTGPDPTNPNRATVGDTVSCRLIITGLGGTMPDIPSGSTATVSAVGGNYTFSGGLTNALCVTNGTACAIAVGALSVVVTCAPAGCGILDLRVTETLSVTSANPSTITQHVTITPPGGGTPLFDQDVTDPDFVIVVPAGTTFYVAPNGDDSRNCRTRETACKTVNRALEVARDRDTIVLLVGEYDIQRTIKVTKLVTIQPDSGAKVVLKAQPGVTIFEVTAQGGRNVHVIIQNFTMGGNLQPRSSAPAILLLNDSYTEIANNVIGAEDLPINNGIVLSNSDYPNIHDNLIQGSSRFAHAPVLRVGRDVTGFGVVTAECLGAVKPGISDSVTIRANLFTNLWIAGVWLCSDGGGGHVISGNDFRNNWRGIALKDVTNSTVADNVLLDERSDGIILYGASLRNLIDNNRIESHVAPDAAGIRIGWLADPIVPLDNRVERNRLIRDTVAIHIFGARTTQLHRNDIKITGFRTAILITPSFPVGLFISQPTDTEITDNVIVFSGACTAVVGCAIRLLGTMVAVLATDNDWGLRRAADVARVIWDHEENPALGVVTFIPFKFQIMEVTAAPPGAAATPPAGSPSPVPAPTMPPVAVPTPPLGPPPVTGIELAPGCTTVRWPGVDGYSVVDAALGLMPIAAVERASIWMLDNGEWRGWNGTPGAPSEVFLLRRNAELIVCVDRPATWLIPTQVGGP
jgi:parallel beta-helix repeat protein